LFSRWGKPPTV